MDSPQFSPSLRYNERESYDYFGTESITDIDSASPSTTFKTTLKHGDFGVPTSTTRSSVILDIPSLLSDFMSEINGDHPSENDDTILSRDSRAGLAMSPDLDDSEDFVSAERRFSHYVKTTEYEQGRLKELQVTIEYYLQSQFKDIMLVETIFKFLGPLSQDDYEWIGVQAEADYFLNELRWPQYKSFLRYIFFYDDPPVEVDREQWEKESHTYICTVIFFTILFPLVLPCVMLQGCRASSSYFSLELHHYFDSLSLIWKILFMVFAPVVFVLILLAILLSAIFLALVRLLSIPSDIITGWRYMCGEKHWVFWLDSIHNRAEYMRYFYDLITPTSSLQRSFHD